MALCKLQGLSCDKSFERILNSPKDSDGYYIELNIALNKVKETYRSGSAAFYLYQCVINTEFEDKFNDEFMKLIYATLDAWNMNSRAAKLSEFEDFKNSILCHKSDFEALKSSTLESITDKDFEVLNKLFNELNLVQTQTPLVTFSKTMHFMLPDLVVPIDRKYTLTFFKKAPNVIQTSKEKQFSLFKELHEVFSQFATEVQAQKYVEEDSWLTSRTKIVDNAIIGSILIAEDEEKNRRIEKLLGYKGLIDIDLSGQFKNEVQKAYEDCINLRISEKNFKDKFKKIVKEYANKGEQDSNESMDEIEMSLSEEEAKRLFGNKRLITTDEII